MNSLNSWLPGQWILLAGLLLVVGLILTLVAIYARRAISRPHVKGLTRDGRQPRLGLVDTYTVDRDRQLVLVRRDNVEHLIMIGGPNDLLVESTILRARPSAQVPRPSGAAVPQPGQTQERVSGYSSAPRQVEEDFVRSPETAATSGDAEPVAPVPPPTHAAAVTTAAAVAAATPAASTVKPSVVPPRDPGFFQRASSRFQNFKSPPPATSVPTVKPDVPAEEVEPRANIDAAHFEELLGAPEGDNPKPVATAKPSAELDFEGTDIEPAPEESEIVATPAPVTTRLTLPEIRLPDLKLPEWRRPEPPVPTQTPIAPTPRPEPRVEPRYQPEPRPLGSTRTETKPVSTDPVARPEPFRIGERLTTPTRPVTPPVVTTIPPVVPEDPFASLEEEMANLLGRTRGGEKKP